MSWYTDKRVFITGGSSGIGRSLALAIAAEGGHVSIAARGRERLDRVLAEIHEIGKGNAHAIALDITDRAACEAAAAEVLEVLGGIDIVFANAGIAHADYFENTPPEVFESMMNVNFFGTVNVIRAFLPTMREQKSGHICNMCSTVGYLPAFGYTAYCPSKFAVTGFSECLRQEVLLDGIKVSVVYPPDTDTPQYEAENETKPPETKMLSDGWNDFMQPEEVAAVTMRGVRKGRLHITPGPMNKFVRFVSYIAPWIVDWVAGADLRRFAKKNRKA